jgi:hypothetical protein
MSGGGKCCLFGSVIIILILVELDLVCAESDADDFSSSSSMYITS